ncbi:VOC family protein [Rhodoplanes sp. Z2-YC6860]|uniref:VOC family protein n=1 Tax=Rhodoplanes sp. Z2-YC6860 TaxID=674703 RepID=UPI00078EA31F|nr:VOC family protein [Rhodoplanes sp. Z2-YC6860]AMN42374.1 glyoxalase [Rhodoplanes sp. Z2-YC6860]
MARAIDHIVHAVHDLDAAADLYRRLGFQVGARNTHPRDWGTQNHVIQLPGVYIELLAMADATEMAPHSPRFFSFGAFNRDFLKRGQGPSMLVLEGRGAPDVETFRAAGIGDFDLYEFQREGRRPDDTTVKLAFALAFASNKLAPDTGFFSILHRHPENFWNPVFQKHPNTATAIAGVVLVADNPSDHRAFLEAFAGPRGLVSGSSGISIKTHHGEIQVMRPGVFLDRFGTEPPTMERGARLAAIRFAFRDLDAATEQVKTAATISSSRMGYIALGPDNALGATLMFERI